MHSAIYNKCYCLWMLLTHLVSNGTGAPMLYSVPHHSHSTVSAKVGSMPTSFPTAKKQFIFLHRDSITCSWNGSCRTSSPQFHLNQTVFFGLRSKLSLGSLQAYSPPNEELAPDAFSDHWKLNIKMNSTVVVTRIRMDRSLPFLNSVRRKGELIFTYPLKNGAWNFCVTVISLRSTRVGFQDRCRMEQLYRCPTTLY